MLRRITTFGVGGRTVPEGMMTKIVVVYATAGSGHRRAAEAVYHCLRKDSPELNIAFVDILEYTNLWFANFYSRGYSFVVTHLKFIWAIGYYLTSLKHFSWFFHFICRLNCRRFINLLIKEQPNIILATHFFPVEVISYLKREGKIKSRLVTVVTDFALHPLWVSENCDDYIVSSEYARDSLVARGINQDKIKLLGIPINSAFLKEYQGDGKRDDFAILVATGSFGFSSIEKVVGILFSEAKLLVVCGNNKRLYDRLVRKRYAGVRLFGFTDQMPQLMSQVDLIITKPGALTITEALAMELPLIFISSIPGQETENARILEACGCAIRVKNLKSLKNIIRDLRARPERLALMRTNIQKFRKPNATEEICRYVRSGSF